MDIRTTPPEDYSNWLLSIGVPAGEVRERVARDMILAMTAAAKETGIPEGFEQLFADAETAISDDYTARLRAGLT